MLVVGFISISVSIHLNFRVKQWEIVLSIINLVDIKICTWNIGQSLWNCLIGIKPKPKIKIWSYLRSMFHRKRFKTRLWGFIFRASMMWVELVKIWHLHRLIQIAGRGRWINLDPIIYLFSVIMPLKEISKRLESILLWLTALLLVIFNSELLIGLRQLQLFHDSIFLYIFLNLGTVNNHWLALSQMYIFTRIISFNDMIIDENIALMIIGR